MGYAIASYTFLAHIIHLVVPPPIFSDPVYDLTVPRHNEDESVPAHQFPDVVRPLAGKKRYWRFDLRERGDGGTKARKEYDAHGK